MATRTDRATSRAEPPSRTPLRVVGEPATWDVETAYREHGRELFGFAAAALRDRALAEDAVQEVFVKAWRARARYDPDKASLRTWLFSIARNVVVDTLRAQARRPLPAGDETGDEQAVPGDVAEAVVLRLQLQAALDRVGAKHRHVLVEVHLRGRSQEQVARELGVPVGTVRTRTYYGLRALRAALEQMGHTDGTT